MSTLPRQNETDSRPQGNPYYAWQVISMVPTATGNQGKPGKMGRHFPVREKSGNFVKTGKVREFCPKYWKNRKI